MKIKTKNTTRFEKHTCHSNNEFVTNIDPQRERRKI